MPLQLQTMISHSYASALLLSQALTSGHYFLHLSYQLFVSCAILHRSAKHMNLSCSPSHVTGNVGSFSSHHQTESTLCNVLKLLSQPHPSVRAGHTCSTQCWRDCLWSTSPFSTTLIECCKPCTKNRSYVQDPQISLQIPTLNSFSRSVSQC